MAQFNRQKDELSPADARCREACWRAIEEDPELQYLRILLPNGSVVRRSNHPIDTMYWTQDLIQKYGVRDRFIVTESINYDPQMTYPLGTRLICSNNRIILILGPEPVYLSAIGELVNQLGQPVRSREGFLIIDKGEYATGSV